MFALRRLGGSTQELPRSSLVLPPLPLQNATSSSSSTPLVLTPNSPLAPVGAVTRPAASLPERWTALQTGYLRTDIASIRDELAASLDDADLAVCTRPSTLRVSFNLQSKTWKFLLLRIFVKTYLVLDSSYSSDFPLIFVYLDICNLHFWGNL